MRSSTSRISLHSSSVQVAAGASWMASRTRNLSARSDGAAVVVVIVRPLNLVGDSHQFGCQAAGFISRELAGDIDAVLSRTRQLHMEVNDGVLIEPPVRARTNLGPEHRPFTRAAPPSKDRFDRRFDVMVAAPTVLVTATKRGDMSFTVAAPRGALDSQDGRRGHFCRSHRPAHPSITSAAAVRYSAISRACAETSGWCPAISTSTASRSRPPSRGAAEP
ncbi:hypothetical protein BH09ACT8_BH09ACT8_45870 [soil metagenome]